MSTTASEGGGAWVVFGAILLVAGAVWAFLAAPALQPSRSTRSVTTVEKPTSMPGAAGSFDPCPRAEVQPPEAKSEDAGPPRKVKDMAVAGLFFPGEAKELKGDIETYLAKATPKVEGRVRGLIVPHAGYRYSGPVAAFAYKLLQGSGVKTVILMAPSHYARFRGAALPDEDAFRTPLGVTRVATEKVAALAQRPPFAVNPPASVYTPEWSVQSPIRAPERETPHTWEHSEEVQIPFLQTVLKDFRLVPMVLGAADEAEIAKGLLPLLDDTTVVVASSDLSHYHPYEEARQLDGACVKSILQLEGDALGEESACGRGPIRVLLALAKARHWRAHLLDLRNSGDTSGDKARGVVGYAAIAFVEPAGPVGGEQKPAEEKKAGGAEPKPAAAPGDKAAPAAQYPPEQRRFLLDLARKTVAAHVSGKAPPDVKPESLAPALREVRGCFVTLTKAGQLRGCIGHITAREALWRAVIDNAVNAATRDPRFDPVTAQELPSLHVEISVLTPPRPLAFDSPEDLLRKLRPHVDGVVLYIGPACSTFLPQVWEQIPEKEEFLGHLSRKAGCGANAWRGAGVRVETYQVEAFQEKDFAGR